MGLAAGHCGQAHVKKSGTCIYNFWFAPEIGLSRDLSTREGRLNGKAVLFDGIYYMYRQCDSGGQKPFQFSGTLILHSCRRKI